MKIKIKKESIERDITIEKARAEDIKWVQDTIKRQGWIYDDIHHVFIAKIDGKPVGMARAEFFRKKKLATLAGVFVEPELRGLGIGHILVKKIIDAFPDILEWHLAGHSWIESYYSKIGFKKTQVVIPELKREFKEQIFMVLRK